MYHKHVLLGFESKENLERLRNNLKYCRTEEGESSGLSHHKYSG